MHPAVLLETLNPLNAVEFYVAGAAAAHSSPWAAVVLAVTGAEALYADMGHFGRRPIRVSLALFRHAGVAAQLYGAGRDAPVADPAEALETVKNPFFFLAPECLPPAAGPPGDRWRRSSPARR